MTADTLLVALVIFWFLASITLILCSVNIVRQMIAESKAEKRDRQKEFLKPFLINDKEKGCEYCTPVAESDSAYGFGREFGCEYEASVYIRTFKGANPVLMYEDENGENEIYIDCCPNCGRNFKGNRAKDEEK